MCSAGSGLIVREASLAGVKGSLPCLSSDNWLSRCSKDQELLLMYLFSAATPSSSIKLLVSRETLPCLYCLSKLCSGGWFVLLA